MESANEEDAYLDRDFESFDEDDDSSAFSDELSGIDRCLFNGIYQNDAAAVQRALQNGADVNCRASSTEWLDEYITPLTVACGRTDDGSDEIVRILLKAGATWRNYSESPSILAACEKGNLTIVKALLNHDESLLEFANYFESKPLVVAIYYRQTDIVQFLLERGANIHATDSMGTGILTKACQCGSVEIMSLLLTAGLDLEANSNSMRQTLLHRIARDGSVYVLRRLIVEHNQYVCSRQKWTNTI
jgi:ankyrin repeat protein